MYGTLMYGTLKLWLIDLRSAPQGIMRFQQQQLANITNIILRTNMQHQCRESESEEAEIYTSMVPVSSSRLSKTLRESCMGAHELSNANISLAECREC